MENEEWVSGSVRLNLFNNPINVEINVPSKPVKLRRMLPIFHAMSNLVVDATVSVTEASGAKISCQAGCGACCRQVVPITESEIYQLQELVEIMPEPRRTMIRARFAAACERLHEIRWLERMEKILDYTDEERNELALEYFREGIPCPFLENESCSIHPHRPLVCREYLVTSPAENCSAPTAAGIDKVELPMKVSHKVARMDFAPADRKTSFVPMIRVLEMAASRPEPQPEKTGPEWMNEFFTLMQK